MNPIEYLAYCTYYDIVSPPDVFTLEINQRNNYVKFVIERRLEHLDLEHNPNQIKQYMILDKLLTFIDNNLLLSDLEQISNLVHTKQNFKL